MFISGRGRLCRAICSSREIIGKSNSVRLDRCHIFTIRNQLPVFCSIY